MYTVYNSKNSELSDNSELSENYFSFENLISFVKFWELRRRQLRCQILLQGAAIAHVSSSCVSRGIFPKAAAKELRFVSRVFS